MKSRIKLPATTLGKASLLLIILTLAIWLFANNANNCLSRDFVEKAPPAVCWRQTNDYESTIEYSQLIGLGLLVLAIICSSVAITKLRISRSHATPKENKSKAWYLATLSMILLIFIITLGTVYQKTTFDNNNYALNTATATVTAIGTPLWLALAASAVTYGVSSHKRRND
jgi:hypothetical protein